MISKRTTKRNPSQPISFFNFKDIVSKSNWLSWLRQHVVWPNKAEFAS